MRATTRVTGAAKNTVTKLLVDLGEACAEYQDVELTNLATKTVECDEIWSFCYSKQKNVPEEHQGTHGYGDVWTWVAIDADTKLVPSWLVGERTVHDAYVFMLDLKSRLKGRIQLTTDGHKPYLTVVEPVFGADGIDFAMLHKIYGSSGRADDEQRYSPRRLHRNRRAGHHRGTRPFQDLDQLRRAAEPHHVHGTATLHPAHQRILQEGREPGPRCQPPLHALQLRTAPQGTRKAQHTSNGRRSCRISLDHVGHRPPTR